MGVRREKVILELEDLFTRDMLQAAAATAAARRELRNLSGTSVQTSRDTERVRQSVKAAGDEIKKTGSKAREGSNDIDRYSGRLRLLVELIGVLGPGLVPIGAVAVPAVMALTAGLGAAAGALGTTILAVSGLGDAFKALNDYQLEPTRDNLEKLQEEFGKIGPAGRDFVRYLDSLEPQLRVLQGLARQGLFPGVERGIDELLDQLPQVRQLVYAIASGLGDLAGDTGEALAGDRFEAFFDYLQTDAASTMESFARSTGNVAEAIANLLVAFAPLTRGFSSGLERMTREFAEWSAELSQTQGFKDFVIYVQDSAPRVLAFFGALGTAFVGIVRAAAPVGDVVLPVLTELLRLLAALANSPLGGELFAAAAGVLAFSRATSILTSGPLAKLGPLLRSTGTGLASLPGEFALLGTSAATAGAKSERELARIETSARHADMALASIGKGITFAAIIAGIWGIDKAFDAAFGDKDIDSQKLPRNLEALADGRVEQNLKNLGNDLRNLNMSSLEWTDKVFGFLPGDTDWNKAKENIDKVDEALASMVESGNVDQAKAAFQQIQQMVKDQGGNTAETAKWFKQYDLALKNVAPSTDQAAAAQEQYAAALARSQQGLRLTTAQVNGFTKAMEENRSEALKSFDAVTAYAEALDAARKQAKDSNAGLNASTKEGRENRKVLSSLAKAWNDQGPAVRNSISKWREARKAFIDTATGMGVPIERAKVLADRLLAIPRQRVAEIRMRGIRESTAAVDALRQGIANLTGKTITITTIRKGTSVVEPHASIPAGADGATVPKTGRPYADRHLYLLADGEEVISNRHGQADRFRADRAAGRIPGYADGGRIGPGDPRQIQGIGSAAYLGPALSVSRLPKPIRGAASAFDLHGGMSTSEVRQELRSFASAVRKAGFEVGKSFDHLGHQAVVLSKSYESNAKRIDTLRSQASDIRTGAAGSFMHDAFGGDLAAFALQVSADRNDANAMTSALKKAGRRGLDGPLAEALSQSGNLALAQQFAGLSRGQIASYERLYGQRATASANLGSEAVAISGLPRRIDRLVTSQQRLITRLNNLEERLEESVRRGAHSGTAQREKDRNRDANNRVRAGR